MSNRAACGMLCVERSGTDDIQANEVPSNDEEFPLDYGDNFLDVAVNAFVPNVGNTVVAWGIYTGRRVLLWSKIMLLKLCPDLVRFLLRVLDIP